MEPKDIESLEVEKAAKVLGFVKQNGFYYHNDNKTKSGRAIAFDFSATAPDKIMLAVWNKGKAKGEYDASREIALTLDGLLRPKGNDPTHFLR